MSNYFSFSTQQMLPHLFPRLLTLKVDQLFPQTLKFVKSFHEEISHSTKKKRAFDDVRNFIYFQINQREKNSLVYFIIRPVGFLPLVSASRQTLSKTTLHLGRSKSFSNVVALISHLIRAVRLPINGIKKAIK